MKKALLFAVSLLSISAFSNASELTIETSKSGITGSFPSQVYSSQVAKENTAQRVYFQASGSASDTFTSKIEYKGNIYLLTLDNVNQRVEISGFSNKKTPLIVTEDLKQDIKHMLHSAQLHAEKIQSFQSTLDHESNTTLLKFFEFLATYPVNTPIEQHIDVASGPKIAGWTNICSAMGSRKTAFWDLDNNTAKRKSYIVGGHGFCAGRCGAGCPMFGDGQYTQDCLNHDACADVEGEQLGNCSDEWVSASDDFWFSPDCETPPPSS